MTLEPPPAARPTIVPRETWPERWAPLGALLWAVLFLVFFLGSQDDTDDTPAGVIEFATEESTWIDFGLVFGLLSLLLLGWFVGGLYLRLRRLGADVESVLALIGGITFTLLSFMALMLWEGFVAELDDEDNAAVQAAQAATYLAIEDVGWVTLGGAGVGAGLMAMAASAAALRTGWVPAWAAWIGIVLGIISLATAAFFGIIAWFLWIVLASGLMLVRSLREPRAVA